jgi:hypothetical protein
MLGMCAHCGDMINTSPIQRAKETFPYFYFRFHLSKFIASYCNPASVSIYYEIIMGKHALCK